MTLYELLKQISDIITPDDNSFYRYALHTSDDNGGFLRTRHCWRLDRPIKDRDLGEGYECVLVTAKDYIKIEDLHNESDTLVKMQITYSEKNPKSVDAEWDAQLGYCYVYIFNLKTHEYTKTFLQNPCP